MSGDGDFDPLIDAVKEHALTDGLDGKARGHHKSPFWGVEDTEKRRPMRSTCDYLYYYSKIVSCELD